MKTTISRGTIAALCALLIAAPARAQQLIDDWLVRTTATPDALVAGATAVFRNAAALAPAGKGEAMLLDLRGPDVSGITGMALAGSYRLDARTSVGFGYQHVGFGSIEVTEDAPDEGTRVEIGQDLFAVGATHALRALHVGANASYSKSADILNEKDVLRLGIGFLYAASKLPVTFAGDVQSQDVNTMWSAAAAYRPRLPLPDWHLGASYGVSGATTRNGVAHRVTADGVWKDLFSLQAGAVVEPESGGSNVTAIGSVGVRVKRYELGVVRETLANGFGAVHTFRIGIVF